MQCIEGSVLVARYNFIDQQSFSFPLIHKVSMDRLLKIEVSRCNKWKKMHK